MAIELQASEKPAGRNSAKRAFEFSLRPAVVADRDRRFFTEQLALLLSTGTDLHTSLVALRAQADNDAVRSMIDALIEDVSQGKQFSVALARHPGVFSTTYVNLIGASEGGGYMHEVLAQLLDMEDRREKLTRAVFSALAYPTFLLIFALAVVIFVLVVVFPKFADLFSSIADQLPSTTHFLMQASELFIHQWPLIVTGAALALFAAKYWVNTARGRQQTAWMKLNIPPLRAVFGRLYLAQSLRVLGLSLNHGVGIIEALRAARDVVDNARFSEFLHRVENNVQTGEGIAVGFENVVFIPPVVAQMVHTGEDTGNLPKVLARLADHYERELTVKLDTLSRLAEPVMLLIMGGIVGIIVSSLILPIFKLTRAVG